MLEHQHCQDKFPNIHFLIMQNLIHILRGCGRIEGTKEEAEYEDIIFLFVYV